ncbi:hypothetical protein OIO90_001214 [Microbotryomycetes sp. JL221]|nr:hypothetical protein OIO90_001214 [Microbotryomycetes sp. JL221]
MDKLPLNGLTVAISGTGMILSSAFDHLFHRRKITKETEARDSFLYNEAFSVLKAFFEKGSLHTVEEVQRFGNTFVPSPSWVRVIRVVIPPPILVQAAHLLIETVGEQEMKQVIGGTEWWQRRSHPEGGVDAEWISMKKDWRGLDNSSEADDDPASMEDLQNMKLKFFKDAIKDDRQSRKQHETQNASSRPREQTDSYAEDMDSMRCVLYIHGGAHLFGSINTHRYQIWRYARKIGGRAFAVKYRLSPQYPFPCALQDCLAAYLYLIRPPPGVKHKPIDPSKLVVAGDSAGGGLTLALMTMLRDSGLPMPAGMVLISPWVDLTHSFPSILQNTATDIIPPYGFLFKPSTLWPPPPTDFQKKAKDATTIDGLKKAAKQVHDDNNMKHKKNFLSLKKKGTTNKKGQELADAVESLPNDDPQAAEGQQREHGQSQNKGEPAERIKIKIDGEEIELTDQIQLYATNEQLVHPLVSPLWTPSLGGLPPTYILAGDKEVLRDEIVYLAHRMAHPDRYPLRKELLESNPERTRKQQNLPPTLVHLQVYDGVCHDLPILSFTTPAKYCYRAISSFIKFVTTTSMTKGSEGENKVQASASPVSPTMMKLPVEEDPHHEDAKIHVRDMADKQKMNDSINASSTLLQVPQQQQSSTNSSSVSFKDDSELTNRRNGSTEGFASPRPAPSRSSTFASSTTIGSSSTSTTRKITKGLEKTIYSSTQPFNRPDYVDNMIRERISLTGVVRPLEPEKDIDCLNLNPEDLGIVKEAPVKRYLAGKAIWDKKFKSVADRVQREREDNLRKSMKEEATRITERMKKVRKNHEIPSVVTSNQDSPSSPLSPIQQVVSPQRMDSRDEQVRGIWDFRGENPPPSSIAARKDTREARALAKTLDDHYNKLHALNVWSEFNDISARTMNAVQKTRSRVDSRVKASDRPKNDKDDNALGLQRD